MRFLFIVFLPLYSTAIAQSSPASGLFQDHATVTLRLETDLHALFRDRGAQRKDHPALLHYTAATDSGSVTAKLRTRGIFRLKNCAFPPIRLDLPSHKTENTPFAAQDR